MKTAVVFYSMGRNTAMVAEKLADALSADLIGISPERAYPDRGFRKYFWGGKSAVLAEAPKLQPYTFDAEGYDLVIIGFPVWASGMAPPVRTFVLENRNALKAKKIAAFACESGSGGEKALRKLADCLGRDTLAASMILIDPKDRPKPENDQRIAAFLKQLPG